MRHAGFLVVVLSVALLTGCPQEGSDAGPADMGTADAGELPPCLSNNQCNDLNPCSDDFCVPDDPKADPDGCIYIIDDTNQLPTIPGDCMRELCQGGVLVVEVDDTESPGFNLPGDCVAEVCMDGMPVFINDDSEVPFSDGDPCTEDLCMDGMQVYPAVPEGTLCDVIFNVQELCIGGLCVPSTCGDGELTAPEVCDPGPPVSGDGCSNFCLQPPALVPSYDLAAVAIPVQIYGASAGDRLGAAGSLAIGDVDDDGIDDLVVGSPVAGVVHVVLGTSAGDDTWPAVIDLATDADVTIAGPAGSFPSSIALGDVSGDGVADIVIGASAADGGAGAGSGAVWVLQGRDFSSPAVADNYDVLSGDADFSFQPGSAGDQLGAAVAVGDVTGNGVGDVILGAPGGDGPGDTFTDVGDVYVFQGGSFVGGSIDVTLADALFYGEIAGDEFGAALGAGHVGGSAVADVLIGAPGHDAPGGVALNAGSVFVFFGTAFSTTVLDAASADVTISGDAGDALGASLAWGDFNADGAGDLLMGAPEGDTFGDANTDEGDAYALWGPFAPGTLLATVEVLPEFFGGGAELYGEGAEFGAAVAAGDINDDGYWDILTGDSVACSAAPCAADGGEVYVVLGRPFDTPGSLGGRTRFDVRDSNQHVVFRAAAASDHLGASLAVGDLDGDGLADLAFGAPDSDTPIAGRIDAGAVIVFFGGTNPTPP